MVSAVREDVLKELTKLRVGLRLFNDTLLPYNRWTSGEVLKLICRIPKLGSGWV